MPFVSGLEKDAFGLLASVLDKDEIVGDVFEFLLAINLKVILNIFHILRKACCLVNIDWIRLWRRQIFLLKLQRRISRSQKWYIELLLDAACRERQ